MTTRKKRVTKTVKKAPLKWERARRATADDMKAMDQFVGLTEEVRVPIDAAMLDTVKRTAVLAGTTQGTVLSVLLAMAVITAMGSKA